MAVDTARRTLEDIDVAKIDRNPENPRIFFRPQELDELAESIRRHGVQVPIAVYKAQGRYVLLDGERRWRCSIKLNRKKIPAIIQDRPDALTNLVLMFNIHALREQWDLLTIALKLPRVIELYSTKHGREPKEQELSEETGLTRSVIRRCRLLMALPPHHIDRIKAELKKPKAAQKISEDFYIEMERALKTVSRSMPELLPDEAAKENARQILLRKYEQGAIGNIVDFRQLARMARAEKVGADKQKAMDELTKVLKDNSYSIRVAYDKSVSAAYSERDLLGHLERLIEELKEFPRNAMDDRLTELLRSLVCAVDALLME